MRTNEIKLECALRLVSQNNRIQKLNMHLPNILAKLETYFNAIAQKHYIDTDELEDFLQTVELILDEHTLFVQKFKRDMYTLNHANKQQ